MAIRRRIRRAVWRAFAPVLALVLVLGPLAWVVERRALLNQGGEVLEAAQMVWDQVESGQVQQSFGEMGKLPAARRAREPFRDAECAERVVPLENERIEARAVLCRTSDGKALRYLAVGLSWRDAAPVRDWIGRHIDGRLPWLTPWLQSREQGVLLHEERWP